MEKEDDEAQPQDYPRPVFSNPISKSTFEALPKIYGYRKKKKFVSKLNVSPRYRDGYTIKDVIFPKDLQISIQNTVRRHARLERLDLEKQKKRIKTEPGRIERSTAQLLSKPKKVKCLRKHCCCNKVHETDLVGKKSRGKKHMKSMSLRLPEYEVLRGPDDQQSRHKVMMRQSAGDGQLQHAKKSMNMIDLLRQSRPLNAEKSSQIDESSEDNSDFLLKEIASHHVQSVEVQTQPYEADEKKPTESRATGTATNLPVSHQEGLSNPLDDSGIDDAKARFERLKANRRQEKDDEDEDRKSVASSLSSVSISNHIFRGKHSNTMFHLLKRRDAGSRSEMYRSRHKRDEKSEGKSQLFVIPEQQQYVNYLKDYEPMGKNFKVKSLVRKPNFQVVKSDEGVYFGEVQNEQRSGKGIMVTSKQIFEGEYEENVKVFGHEKNIDGVYEGEFINGVRQGYGRFEWYNGQTFEGEWRKGTKNGYGIWRSPNGDSYEGEWKMNRQYGKGEYKHRLSTYRGYFKDFLKHGQGQERFVNGDSYKGQYKEGKPDGQGLYQWGDGSWYEGDFVKGLREGKGVWHQINGSIYEGQFYNDYKEGSGQETLPSGELFIGNFHEGRRIEGDIFDSKRVKNDTIS